MRLLVVHCHPDPDSFNAALKAAAVQALQAAGHELRVIDLYAMGFDPVLSRAEKARYLPRTEENIAALAEHVDALRWAEGWVAIFPTWIYGPPAMLKGWLERVWLPGVAFTVARGKQQRQGGLLRNLRYFAGVTSSGSPWWWLKLNGDPGRSLFMKGLRPLYAARCRMRWLQLYNMNHTSGAERQAFIERVRREFAALR